MVALNFNVAQYENLSAYEPVPEAWYLVRIVKSDMKPTKAGDGSFLEMSLEIIEGPQKGKILYLRANYINKSEKAVEMGLKLLATVARCVGIYGTVADSAMLHNIPFQAFASVKKGENDQISNELQKFKDANGNDPVGPNGQPSGQQQAPQGFQQAPQQQTFAQPQQGFQQSQPQPQPAAQAPQPGFAQSPSGAPQGFQSGVPGQAQPQAAGAFPQPSPGQGFPQPQPAPQPAPAPQAGFPQQQGGFPQPQGQQPSQGQPQPFPGQGNGQGFPGQQGPQGGTPAAPWTN